MKKVSKKLVADFLTATKGETNWSVLSFDKKTGVRVLGYGGHDFISAFAVMTQELHKGLDVILTDKAGWDFCMDYECRNSGNGIYNTRVTYKDMKPYEIAIGEYSFEIRHFNK